MDQIPQSIINSLLGGALATLGWFARQIWDAIKELRTDLAALARGASIPLCAKG